MSEVNAITLISTIGFPAFIAVWALREMRSLTKENSENLKTIQKSYVEDMKQVMKEYEGVCSRYNGCVTENTSALVELRKSTDKLCEKVDKT